MDFTTVPNDVLGYWIYQALHRWYGLSGVSLGRSSRTRFFEPTLFLVHRFERPFADGNDIDKFDLIDEGLRRQGKYTLVQTILFPDRIELITDYTLVRLLLRRMLRWYERNDPKRHWTSFEWDCVKAILGCWPPLEDEGSFPRISSKDLLLLAEDRFARQLDLSFGDFE